MNRQSSKNHASSALIVFIDSVIAVGNWRPSESTLIDSSLKLKAFVRCAGIARTMYDSQLVWPSLNVY